MALSTIHLFVYLLRGLHRSINSPSTVTKILLTLYKIYKSLLRLQPSQPHCVTQWLLRLEKNPCRKNVSTCSVRDENSCGEMCPDWLKRIRRGMPLKPPSQSCTYNIKHKLLWWKEILRGAWHASVARYAELLRPYWDMRDQQRRYNIFWRKFFGYMLHYSTWADTDMMSTDMVNVVSNVF